MAWVCFLEEDLDDILGETEAEVRCNAGQAEAAVEEGRAPDEGLPLPGVEDILGPSGEAPLQEEEKEDVHGKTPL
ncbi:UNVERIFIED_CONTAM: hypothetical protein Sangu_1857200 [Sesamum angustifolium]|uniref:Uncharacterized protein n=1 Tax=Sesamum angustifolium TaxID=2727405 RepID=A0AAW2MBK9_9LAMI